MNALRIGESSVSDKLDKQIVLQLGHEVDGWITERVYSPLFDAFSEASDIVSGEITDISRTGGG